VSFPFPPADTFSRYAPSIVGGAWVR